MSKEAILNNIVKNKPEQRPLPPDFAGSSKISAADLMPMFKESLKTAGAEVLILKDKAELSSHLTKQNEDLLDFGNKEVRKKYPDNSAKADLEKIGVVLLHGQMGVAENGAIWLDDSDFPHRLIPFITQKLIITLNKENILPDMHQAYRKINLDSTGFGIFISGPSKTADIEQSLVYGAHGAKELTVILY